MKTQKEKELLTACILLIEEKLGWGKSTNWHSEVFTELSEVIQKQTKVVLSPTTLKRVWGKVYYNSSPSISTLNTLAQFIGFLNWRDFKNKQTTGKSKKRPELNMPLVFTLAAGIALLFITLFSAISSNTKELSAEDLLEVKFSSKVITNGMPNSIVFDFDLASLSSDSMYIQQYWDRTKTIKINSEQKQATGIYYFPGYFRAKLVVDGTIIKEHDLFIKSNGWSASIDYEPIPKYIKAKDFLNHGLSLNNSLISEVKSSQQPIHSTYHFIDDLGAISGDNFTLETTLKHSYNEKWAVCQTTGIYLIGTKGALIIPLTIPGCISDISVMLNDVFLDGKKQDLSPFGVDMASFKDLKVQVVNKKLDFLVNGQNIFSASYNKSLGNLVGLRFKFLGAGEVKHVEIKDAYGKSIIKDNF